MIPPCPRIPSTLFPEGRQSFIYNTPLPQRPKTFLSHHPEPGVRPPLPISPSRRTPGTRQYVEHHSHSDIKKPPGIPPNLIKNYCLGVSFGFSFFPRGQYGLVHIDDPRDQSVTPSLRSQLSFSSPNRSADPAAYRS